MKNKKYRQPLDVNEIDPIILFMVLYNNSKQQGMGLLDSSGVQDIDQDEAKSLLSEQPAAYGVGMHGSIMRQRNPKKADLINEWIDFQPKTLDYVRGRVMKCSINGIELDTWGYDRDNGKGAAQACIDEAKFLQRPIEDIQGLLPSFMHKTLDEDKEVQDG